MATKRRLAKTERIIAKSRDATAFSKKCIIWLLRQSNNGEKNVCLSLEGEMGRDLAHASHDMQSSCSKTRLDFRATGLAKHLSHHSGIYIDGEFVGDADGGTVWFSDKLYDSSAEKLSPDMAAIKAIKLRKL